MATSIRRLGPLLTACCLWAHLHPTLPAESDIRLDNVDLAGHFFRRMPDDSSWESVSGAGNATLRGFVTVQQDLAALGDIGSAVRATFQTATRSLVVAQMANSGGAGGVSGSVAVLGLWQQVRAGGVPAALTVDYLLTVDEDDTTAGQARAVEISTSLGTTPLTVQSALVIGWSRLALLRNATACSTAARELSTAEQTGAAANDATTSNMAQIEAAAALAAVSTGCGVNRDARRDDRRPAVVAAKKPKEKKPKFELSAGATLFGWATIATISALLFRKLLWQLVCERTKPAAEKPPAAAEAAAAAGQGAMAGAAGRLAPMGGAPDSMGHGMGGPQHGGGMDSMVGGAGQSELEPLAAHGAAFGDPEMVGQMGQMGQQSGGTDDEASYQARMAELNQRADRLLPGGGGGGMGGGVGGGY